MGLSHGYGPVPERNEALRLIREVFELGCTFFNTAEDYGAGDNEILVGEALAPIRDKAHCAMDNHTHKEEQAPEAYAIREDDC
jgi:aryl-alcohol dehydrogenase-like predicted oxidoreductase